MLYTSQKSADLNPLKLEGTYGIENAAQGLEFFLQAFLLALELPEAQMPHVAVGEASGGRAGRHGWRMHAIHHGVVALRTMLKLVG